jgi:UDP-N-acetylmuramate dehydrogenase
MPGTIACYLRRVDDPQAKAGRQSGASLAVSRATGLSVQTDVPLRSLTTLELGGPARFLIEAQDEATVLRATLWAAEQDVPMVVLGGGSNVVVSDAGFDGLVLRMGLRGSSFGDGGTVYAAAGEPWDAFVEATVAHGWAGLECLAGIPGSVGATPIQNVGAYGQEVAETIHAVRALDRDSRSIVQLSVADCAFGYRDSLFRRSPEAYVVLGVTFALRPGGVPSVRYRELDEALAGRPQPSLADVSATVRALRRKKSMVLAPDDPNRRSVGSFFTNPVLDPAAFAALAARAVAAGIVANAAEVPRFGAPGDRIKVPAAWMIERAGFTKGLRRGPVGISSAHALALVHHGGGTTAALRALAEEIRAGVRARFGVTLTEEPIFLGTP